MMIKGEANRNQIPPRNMYPNPNERFQVQTRTNSVHRARNRPLLTLAGPGLARQLLALGQKSRDRVKCPAHMRTRDVYAGFDVIT